MCVCVCVCRVWAPGGGSKSFSRCYAHHQEPLRTDSTLDEKRTFVVTLSRGTDGGSQVTGMWAVPL